MKLSELIIVLQKLQDLNGDVDFVFDWGADVEKLKENDIKLNYCEYAKTHVLCFFN
jgi:hypothetical protein